MNEQRHALLITSSVYDDPQLHGLATPGNDARALGAVLRDPRIGAFNVRRLTNPTSWRAATEVEAFFGESSYDEVLLLYFSGHGLKSDDGELYFATRNTRRRTLRSTSLSARFVHDVMDDSGSDRQILILDCCYGGAFARRLAKSGEAVDVAERLQGFGTVVLTASNSLQFAWQGEQIGESPPQSIFTKVIVDGLKSGAADLNKDGEITIKELYDYALKGIRGRGAPQTPTMSAVGQEGDLVIGRAPGGIATRQSGFVIDMSEYLEIHDQGNEGSVVGHALAAAMECSLRYHGRYERLSGRYANSKARFLTKGESWHIGGGGAVLSDGLKAATKFGLPLESAWPYVAGTTALPAGETWQSMDRKRPRFRARLDPIMRWEEIPYHLVRGRPIICGLSVFRETWFAEPAMSTGRITVASTKESIGGYVVVIVGYDGESDELKFAASWGTRWGDCGFGYIARAAVEQSLNSRFDSSNETAYWAIDVPLDGGHCLEANDRP